MARDDEKDGPGEDDSPTQETERLTPLRRPPDPEFIMSDEMSRADTTLRPRKEFFPEEPTSTKPSQPQDMEFFEPPVPEPVSPEEESDGWGELEHEDEVWRADVQSASGNSTHLLEPEEAEEPESDFVPFFRIQEGEDAGSDVPLDQPEVTIGRSPGNVCVVREKSVSRYHARISRLSGSWKIIDLGSGNGSFLNNVAFRHADLAHGDVVALGDLVFQIHLKDQPAEARQFSLRDRLNLDPELQRRVSFAFVLLVALSGAAVAWGYASLRAAPPRDALFARFEEGVTAFRAGDWGQALGHFGFIAQYEPNFPRNGMYLEAARRAPEFQGLLTDAARDRETGNLKGAAQKLKLLYDTFYEPQARDLAQEIEKELTAWRQQAERELELGNPEQTLLWLLSVSRVRPLDPHEELLYRRAQNFRDGFSGK